MNRIPLALLLVLTACTPQSPPPRTVEALDLARYSGTWYEIARYPNRFQRDCYSSVAIYSPKDNGRLEVRNRCRSGSPEGPWREVTGVAWRADRQYPGRLKVRFFWPFSGPYWVMLLDRDYRWSVVGHPRRTYLWILARTPTIGDGLYRDLLGRIAELGYDPGKLIRSASPPASGDH